MESRNRLVLNSTFLIIVIGWFTFAVAGYMNGVSSDVMTIIANNIYKYPISPESTLGLLLITFVPLAITAPITEEWVKNHFYRRLGQSNGSVYYGLLLAFGFCAGEALTYWAVGTAYGLSWADLVFRLVFPFHVFNFFVSYRFKFSYKGQALATVFHGLNNGIVFLSISWPLIPVARIILPIYSDLLYSLNYLAMVAVAWHVLKKLPMLTPEPTYKLPTQGIQEC